MGRPRGFDWGEAVRLHESGVSLAEISRRLGVSTRAVTRAVNPNARAKMDEISQRMARNRRQPCLGGCGKLVWMHAVGRNPTGYCPQCIRVIKSGDVQDDLLLCQRCEQWKPDDAFCVDPKSPRRRSRRPYCRACDTEVRQEYRLRNKQPCVVCGAPSLPSTEKRSSGFHQPRCRKCYDESRRKAESTTGVGR